ncbi:MAG: putative glycoside hydrolase [Candidatus Hydrogenedentota bacterium]
MRGVYLNPAAFYERKIIKTIHYAKEAGLNAVVMHVKDPFGHIYWEAENALAREMKASKGDKQLRKAVARFNEAGLWTIAKLDLFQDTLLARNRPEWAIQDTITGNPWYNKRDLAWGNPHDERVWDYNIALAKELIALGFDEIQFDYIRFPSDGDLSRVKYPKESEGKDRVDVIGAFLAKANKELKPLGTTLSVDLFGFVAWMTYDFGVGQRIEEIAPHVDALCPMLYPSHFPKDFLGKDDPAKYPREIMEESMTRLKKRTNVEVRPWVQGFWYKPGEVSAQIKGIEATGCKNFFIWSPSSQYNVTYTALATYQNKTYAKPKYYPTLADLAEKGTSKLRGVTHVVNATDYVKGATVLSLDRSSPNRRSAYTTPRQLVDTFDEAILDAILQTRGIESSSKVPRSTKLEKVVGLLLDDLGISARTMRIEPIRIAWKGDCHFCRGAAESGKAQTSVAAVSESKQDVPVEFPPSFEDIPLTSEGGPEPSS